MASLGDPTTPLRSPAPNLTFGPFEFRTASAELRKHGYRVKLPAQTGRVLGALVERPGDLVTRDDLRSLLVAGSDCRRLRTWHSTPRSTSYVRRWEIRRTSRGMWRRSPAGGIDSSLRFSEPPTKAVLEMAAPAALRIEPKPGRQPQCVLLLVAGVAVAVAAGGGYWFAKRSSGAGRGSEADEIRCPAARRICLGGRRQPAIFRSIA